MPDDGFFLKREQKHLSRLSNGERKGAIIKEGERVSGNREEGLKAAKTNIEKYGKDFYSEMGRKGGSGHRPEKRYFHMHPEVARIVGAKGGSKSKRGKKNVKSNLG